MAVLKTSGPTENFKLPSYANEKPEDQAHVDMQTGDATPRDLLKVTETSTVIEIGLYMLLNRIKSWNLTDEQGLPLEINFDNISMLKAEDFKFLTSKISQDLEGLSPEKKETSPSTSATAQTESTPAPAPQ